MPDKPIIIDEFVPAEGSTAKPWKKESAGTAPEAKAFVANTRQFAAAQAAQVAINQGKSKGEVFEAAKSAYESAIEPPAKHQEEHTEDELKIRWLKAVCRLGSGKFDDCTPRDLIDIAMLVDKPVIPFEQWSQAAKEL